MNYVLRFFIVALALIAARSVFASDAQGLAEVRIIEDKFRTLEVKDAADDVKRSDLLEEAAAAVSKLTSSPEKPLDILQIKEIVELLKVSDKYDMYHLVLDQNYAIIKTNEKELKEQLKSLPPKQAKALTDEVDIVLSANSDADAPATSVKSTAKPVVKTKHPAKN
jgi:hypothetical protein